MSNEKMAIRNQVVKPAIPAANDQQAVAGEKTPSPEVVKFELDDNDDFGSDPYNRTGSHCVLKLDDA